MKQWLIGLGVVFMVIMPLHALQTATSPEIIIKIINQCYENENKLGTELAQCVLKGLKNFDNPYGYHVHMTDESPSKTIAREVTIIITDKYGHVLKCKAIAKEKIVFQKCVSEKIPNYTPEKQMSIKPKL